MPYACISVTLLDGLFHGCGDRDQPEWPPSPLRLYQALVAANASRLDEPDVVWVLRWLAEQPAPQIVAPQVTLGTGYRLSVPNNAMDIVGAAWSRGKYEEKGEADPRTHRAMKGVRPHRLLSDDQRTISYCWPTSDDMPPEDDLRAACERLYAFGWGIDIAFATAELRDEPLSSAIEPARECWDASTWGSRVRLRCPSPPTLDALRRRHDAFLHRTSLKKKHFTPIPPLSEFASVGYRRTTDLPSRPHAVFRLIDDDDDQVSYPQSKLVHVAGMVRHLAIERMKQSPPRDLRGADPADWVGTYVAGHQSKEDKEAGVPHTQFSYVPLQTVNPFNDVADPAVRRVMIVAPFGDEAWLEHLAVRLDGQELKPLPGTHLPPGTRLDRIANRTSDGVRYAYTHPATEWASVTPVILPGHDDHKPEKTKKLILKALAQSGIDQPCEFDWSPYSRFRKMLGAHKYVRDTSSPGGKRPVNYIRPEHLLDQSAVHLTLRFGRREDANDPESRWIPANPPIPGPITIGAGRHCGFGLMAAFHG